MTSARARRWQESGPAARFVSVDIRNHRSTSRALRNLVDSPRCDTLLVVNETQEARSFDPLLTRTVTRGTGIACFVLLACALAGATGCSDPAPPVEKLSVIFVTLDTTRADRIGAFGGTAVPTPHLDRIAGEGVKFSAAISQVPLTLPAHSSIFTGRYPASHGVRHNGIYRLPDSETTLAEHLKSRGLETAAFVGAFVVDEGFGLGQGFDTYDDVEGGRYQDGVDRLYEAQRTCQQVNEHVFDWLDGEREERLFLWVHYYDPHDPYAPPEDSGFHSPAECSSARSGPT